MSAHTIPEPELHVNAILGRIDALLASVRRWRRKHPSSCGCDWCRTDRDAGVVAFDLAGLEWALVNAEGALTCTTFPADAIRGRFARAGRRRRKADVPAVVDTSRAAG